MSNIQKGELAFTAGGTSYTLHFSVNALCVLEGATRMNASAIAAMLSDPAQVGMTTIRTLFRCGLSDRHPELGDIEVGRIMTEIGTTEAMRLVGEAFGLAFPAAEDGEEDAGPPRAPTAGTAATAPARGTGSIN